ncbi:MAG: CvfB family protein [Fibrobacterota bacterium]
MMYQLGDYNELTVLDETEHGYLLDGGDREILLPAAETTQQPAPGEQIQVFLYCDSEDRITATGRTPALTAESFAPLKVKEITPIGAFMDWGLPKDLLLPYGEMFGRPEEGETVVVRLCVDDRTERLFATSRLRRFLSPPPKNISPGTAVDALIYEITEYGARAIVNNSFDAMLHRSEFRDTVQIGARISCYIKQIYTDEDKVDISFAPADPGSRNSEAQRILALLDDAGGFLPYSDKSAPEAIQRYFGVSKKTYKKLIGNLLRQGRISITAGGITRR